MGDATAMVSTCGAAAAAVAGAWLPAQQPQAAPTVVWVPVLQPQLAAASVGGGGGRWPLASGQHALAVLTAQSPGSWSSGEFGSTSLAPCLGGGSAGGQAAAWSCGNCSVGAEPSSSGGCLGGHSSGSISSSLARTTSIEASSVLGPVPANTSWGVPTALLQQAAAAGGLTPPPPPSLQLQAMPQPWLCPAMPAAAQGQPEQTAAGLTALAAMLGLDGDAGDGGCLHDDDGEGGHCLLGLLTPLPQLDELLADLITGPELC